MVQSTISLCGRNVDCSGKDYYVEDAKATDPDIAGIGILLSFIVPAIAAIFAFGMAWIRRRIPQQQYNHLDEIALSWLGRCSPPQLPQSDSKPEISGYQTFILMVNDQMLLTGLGLIIAIYSQICSISMFSFHVAGNLAYLCATVHLATLTVLRLPFKESTKAQRYLRVSLMIMCLVGILVTILLQYHTADYANETLAACKISRPRKRPDYEYLWDWLCLVLVLSVNYYQSIITDVVPPKVDRDNATVNSLVLRTLKMLHRYPGSQDDIANLVAEKEQKHEARHLERLTSLVAAINKRRSNSSARQRLLSSVFRNVGFHMLVELQNSLVYDLLLCVFWFALAMTDVVDSLIHDHVDIAPLLEWKFGQVMPVILLLSYALTALGIQSSSSNSKDTVVSEGRHFETSLHDDPGSSVSSDSEVDLGANPGLAMRSMTNSGFSRQNEHPGPRLTRRANTVELEKSIAPVPSAGKPRKRKRKQRPILNIKDHVTHPIDLVTFSRREVKGYTEIVAGVAFIFIIGCLLLVYFYFREAVTCLTAFYISLFIFRVVERSRRIRQIKWERLKREQRLALPGPSSSQALVGSRNFVAGARSISETSARGIEPESSQQRDQDLGSGNREHLIGGDKR